MSGAAIVIILLIGVCICLSISGGVGGYVWYYNQEEEEDYPEPSPAGTPPSGTPPAGTPPAGTPSGTPPAGTPPSVDCDFDWGTWTDCPCGGGQQSRTNIIRIQDSAGGNPCPEELETRSCTAADCIDPDVDCRVSSTEWSPALCPCEGGTQTRTTTILAQPVGAGATCPQEGIQSRTCTAAPGRADCQARDCVIEYGTWEPAVCPCGGGTQTRTNSITTPASGGGTCPLEVETKTCTAAPCPINCAYNSSGWSPTSCPCGGSCVQSRTHTITTQPQHGGTECPSSVKAGIQYQNFSGPECTGTCTYTINLGDLGGTWGGGDISSQNITQSACTNMCNNDNGYTTNCRWVKN
jgi:Thrombospondin type 1 domain